MNIKPKIIGIIIIIIGALPFLMKLEAISNLTFLESITPGSILYQTIVIILGILLVIRLRHNVSVAASR